MSRRGQLQSAARSRHVAQRTREVIAELLRRPPATRAEVAARLEGVDPQMAQQLLIEKMAHRGELGGLDAEPFFAIFEHLGLQHVHPHLLSLLYTPGIKPVVRAYAFVLLVSNVPPEIGKALCERLSAELLTALLHAPLSDLVVWSQARPEAAQQLARLLDVLPQDVLDTVFARIEEVRRKAGTWPALLYAAALRTGLAPELEAMMVHALEADAGPDSIQLLEELKASALEPARERAMQAALLRARTHAIEGACPAPSGYAWAGSVESQGDFVVIACFRDNDGTFTLADVCLRRGKNVRSSFVLLRRSTRDISRLVTALEASGCVFARTSLSAAAQLCEDADFEGADKQAQHVLRVVARGLESRSEGIALVPSAETGSLDQARLLLERPEYRRTWFFEDADLEALEETFPSVGDLTVRWLEQAAGQLHSEERRERVAGMARHMARWHALRGELPEAALCMHFADVTRRSFRTSPLVLALLERTLLPPLDHIAPGKRREPEARGVLRSRFFQQVEAPRGRDLAVLDFAEVVYDSLNEAINSVGSASAIANDEARMVAAFNLAESVVSWALAQTPPSSPLAARRAAEILADCCGLSEESSSFVAASVLRAIEAFFGDVCNRCRVQCLRRSDDTLPPALLSPRPAP